MAAKEAELPRAVRNGPPITVKCECGQQRDLKYGEQWQCEQCGRQYDTRKIPMEEYAAIRRTQVRYRLFPIGAGLLLLAAMIVFFIEGRTFGAIIIVPFMLASWASFGRPFWRARYRRALSKGSPTWTIEAD
jgi:hypothetical protein